MLKLLLLTTLTTLYLFGDNNISSNSKKMILKHSIEVELEDESIRISREIPPKCQNIPIAIHSFWSSDYAGEHIDDECKSTFVKTAGEISPIVMAKGVETFGELEVLNFIDELQADDNMLLLDVRKPLWFEQRTIPSAQNLSFEYIYKADEYPKEFKKALKRLGIKGDKKPYSFKEAKTITIFCNAVWCGQSTYMIKSLLKLGYPPKKIKWYRGGMESWLGLNMSFVGISHK